MRPVGATQRGRRPAERGSRADLRAVASVARLLAGVEACLVRSEVPGEDHLSAPVQGDGCDESGAALVVRGGDLVKHEAVDRRQLFALAVLVAQLDGSHFLLRLPEEEDPVCAAEEAAAESWLARDDLWTPAAGGLIGDKAVTTADGRHDP